jgi:hypothetical protein
MAQETKLVWEELKSSRADAGIFGIGWKIHRAKILGGWLVLAIHNTTGLTFYPDPEHKWDGGSLS